MVLYNTVRLISVSTSSRETSKPAFEQKFIRLKNESEVKKSLKNEVLTNAEKKFVENNKLQILNSH